MALFNNTVSLDTLRRISARGWRICGLAERATQANHAEPLPSCSYTTASAYSLPPPQPIRAELVRKGFGTVVSEKLSQLYMSRAIVLNRLFDGKMQSTMRAWIQSGSETVISTDLSNVYEAYSALYKEALKTWASKTESIGRNEILRRLSASKTVFDITPHPVRSTFKQVR